MTPWARHLPLTGGRPQELAGDLACPMGLLVHNAHLYWSSCQGQIQRLRRPGGRVETVISGQPDIAGLAVAGRRLVWSLGAGRGVLRAAPLRGGSVQTLVAGSFNPSKLVADPDRIFFLEMGASPNDGSDNQVCTFALP